MLFRSVWPGAFFSYDDVFVKVYEAETSTSKGKLLIVLSFLNLFGLGFIRLAPVFILLAKNTIIGQFTPP